MQQGIELLRARTAPRRPASSIAFLQASVKETLAIAVPAASTVRIALQSSAAQRKPSFHTAARQQQSFATGAPIHHAQAAPLDCSTVQRCHHAAQIEAQRAEEQAQYGGGAMTETQATVSLFKTIVGGGILALPAGWRPAARACCRAY